MTTIPPDIRATLVSLGLSSEKIDALSLTSEDEDLFLQSFKDSGRISSRTKIFKDRVIEVPVKVVRHTTKKRIEFHNCVFLSDCRFSSTCFLETVLFEGCIFAKRVSFKQVEFAGVSFKGNRFVSETDFSKAKFGYNLDTAQRTPFGPGFVSFENTRFEKAVNFDGSVFLNGASFENGDFADASFADVQIEGIANFRKTTYGGPLKFSRSEINGETQFEDCQFKATADFSGCVFKRGTHFRGGTTFESGVSFESSAFLGLATFSFTRFCGDADFHASHFHGATTFLNAEWKRLPNFINAVFSSSLDMSSFSSLPIQKHIAEDKKGDRLAACKVRKLKDLAKQNQDLWLELDFFAWELELSELEKQRHRSLFLFIYKYLSDYGRSIMRPLWCFVLTLAVSAFLNVSLGPSKLFHFTQERFGVVKGNCEGHKAERCLSLTESFALALSHMTPFLAPSENLRKKVWPKEYRDSGLHYVGLFSSLVSLVCLFFLLLGLRNRFRMK